MNKAIYAGTFWPFHRGHLDIIWKASTIFDELYVVIAQNANKPDSHTSVEAIEKDIAEFTVSDTKVIKLPPNKLLVDLAEELEVKYLVRGIRGVKDIISEFEMSDINQNLSYDEVTTVFLTSDLLYRHVSSSLIRELVGTDGWTTRIEELVPVYAREEFIQRNSK